jgi:hypothetical protein
MWVSRIEDRKRAERRERTEKERRERERRGESREGNVQDKQSDQARYLVGTITTETHLTIYLSSILVLSSSALLLSPVSSPVSSPVCPLSPPLSCSFFSLYLPSHFM